VLLVVTLVSIWLTLGSSFGDVIVLVWSGNGKRLLIVGAPAGMFLF